MHVEKAISWSNQPSGGGNPHSSKDFTNLKSNFRPLAAHWIKVLLNSSYGLGVVVNLDDMGVGNCRKQFSRTLLKGFPFPAKLRRRVTAN